MFTSSLEEEFFMSHIDSEKNVLEYGSGHSTIQIGNACKTIISVEHQLAWFNRIKTLVSDNCTLIFKQPNLPYSEGAHCGTYEEFKDYVEAPLTYAPFDVILIDGRARVACSSICNKLGHKDTIVFIHDFDRIEYQTALEYLELIKVVENMAKFKIK